ncbi:MAG TPA: response regulator FixJ [Bauldia sp.]|nr:response regulator FixJ [Bauldia sp.]
MPAENIVHIIDDDEAARDALQFLLSAAGLATEVYESAVRFLERLPEAKSGCIITDVRMPGMSGMDLLKLLAERQVGLPVIVITGHGDVALAVEAMKRGAVDFLEKPFDDEALMAAVNSALAARQNAAAEEEQRVEIAARLARLSERERQVLLGLVAGSPNKTIAYDLGISPRTVEVYRANLMTKMQARSLPELVRMALLAGLDRGAAGL